MPTNPNWYRCASCAIIYQSAASESALNCPVCIAAISAQGIVPDITANQSILNSASSRFGEQLPQAIALPNPTTGIPAQPIQSRYRKVARVGSWLIAGIVGPVALLLVLAILISNSKHQSPNFRSHVVPSQPGLATNLDDQSQNHGKRGIRSTQSAQRLSVPEGIIPRNSSITTHPSEQVQNDNELNGCWTAVSMDIGAGLFDLSAQSIEIVIDGGNCAAKRDGVAVSSGSIRIETTKSPKTFHHASKDLADGKITIFRGVYQLQGDDLKIFIVDGSELPKDYTAGENCMIVAFKRQQLYTCNVVIKGPSGGKIRIGDFELQPQGNLFKFTTRKELKPSVPYYYMVIIEADIQGMVFSETRKLRLRAGGTVTVDFSDIDVPNKKQRTLEYWSEVRQILADVNPGKDAAPQDVARALRNGTRAIDDLPLRGVDPGAVSCIMDLVEAANSLARAIDNNSDRGVEAFVRGFFGDPLGVAQEVAAEQRAIAIKIDKAVENCKRMRAVLTERYDVEFPQLH
ncbi:MAG: hypothetical protein JNM56_02685 [Planctomycetia bacterium]|nr:hypothetical protein [Planctomycetia bacterium]